MELDDGTSICLANVGGTFYAISGVCSHMGGPLAEGELEDTVVTCPWHGSIFDVTSGEVLGAPADDDVAKYEARVQGDAVQVAAGQAGVTPGRARS